MDQIKKLLQKIRSKDKLILEETFDLVISRKTDFLDIRKLKGWDNYYRVRKGDYRIIFYMDDDYVKIIFVGNKDDNTYKQF